MSRGTQKSKCLNFYFLRQLYQVETIGHSPILNLNLANDSAVTVRRFQDQYVPLQIIWTQITKPENSTDLVLYGRSS